MPESTEETSTETTEQATGESTETGQQQSETDNGGKGSEKAILADLAKERRERQRLTRELEAEKTKGLSATDKAIADAKAAGRQEAVAEAGKRLAHAELRAAASAKGVDASKQLDYLDLARFVGDDGEPDPSAIADWVKTLSPPSSRPSGSIDQGTRGTAVPKTPGDMFADHMNRLLQTPK